MLEHVAGGGFVMPDWAIPSGVPHNNFRAGFNVGYQAVKGTEAPTPDVPRQPDTPGNMTPFLMGVRRGLEVAGVKLA